MKICEVLHVSSGWKQVVGCFAFLVWLLFFYFQDLCSGLDFFFLPLTYFSYLNSVNLFFCLSTNLLSISGRMSAF